MLLLPIDGYTAVTQLKSALTVSSVAMADC